LLFWHGVLQAPARQGLLTQFDYLPTVSGGNYTCTDARTVII